MEKKYWNRIQLVSGYKYILSIWYFHYSIPERMVLWSHLTCNTRMPIVVFIIPCNCCVFCVCAFFFLFHFVFIIRRIVYGVVLTIAAIISILWKCFSVLEIRFSADVARFYALRPFFDYFLIFFTIPAQFYSLFSAFYSFSTQLNFRISFIFVYCKENCVCVSV